MAGAKASTILLAATVITWTALPASALWHGSTSDTDTSPAGSTPASIRNALDTSKPLFNGRRLAQMRCPACGEGMVRVRVQIRPGVWAWVYKCLNPKCEGSR
jgi:hypothetical protein